MTGTVVEGLTTLEFAELATAIQAVARRGGYMTPVGFRSPPSRPDANRTYRHTRDGHWTVAVRVRHRHRDDVARDMLVGLLAANGVEPDARLSVADRLWEQLHG